MEKLFFQVSVSKTNYKQSFNKINLIDMFYCHTRSTKNIAFLSAERQTFQKVHFDETVDRLAALNTIALSNLFNLHISKNYLLTSVLRINQIYCTEQTKDNKNIYFQ